MQKFPTTRLRRNRSEQWLRNLLQDCYLTKNDFILPLFVCEGKNQKQEIRILPDIYRYSIDNILKQVEQAIKIGINAIMLFPVIDQRLKSNDCKESFFKNNLICATIKAIKKQFSNQIGIISDVALDPYNLSGHDGVLNEDATINNDKTIEILAKQSLVLAEAGVDIVAPSDMMDGRIGFIRNSLDKKDFTNTKIMSYAVKFASNFYGSFRDAIGSKTNLAGASKETYQIPYSNSTDILSEVAMDIDEGADMIIIKPAISYLDIIKKIKDNFDTNIITYQVSSEYAMLKSASEKNYLNYDKAIIEQLIACKRAGANSIICYDSINVVKNLLD